MSRSERFRLTIWHVALGLPLFAVAFVRFLPIRDNSFLWHITAGRVQLERGSVLTADPFSFTRLGEAWRTQSWLAELWYGWADAEWGLGYVPWMVWALAGLYMVAILLIAYRNSRNLVATAAFGVLTTVLSVAFVNPRPVIFSYLLFAALVLAEDDERTRWTTPLLLWIWAGLHGSFAIGGIYLALQAIRRRRWSAWRELAVAAVLVSLTAHGVGTWLMLLDFLSGGSELALITEWAPPDLLTFPMSPLLLAIVVLIWGAIRGRLERRDLIVVVPFLALAFSANRAVPPAWIALAPFITGALYHADMNRSRPSRNMSILHGVLLVALVILPLLPPRAVELDGEVFPVAMAGLLSSERAFHDDATGGYLIYAQWPDRLVYIDDRAELYGDVFHEFARVRAGQPGWDEVLDDWNIDEVLLPAEQPLVETVRLVGWDEVARDDVFVLMRRR